jgi:hypothetical protein
MIGIFPSPDVRNERARPGLIRRVRAQMRGLRGSAPSLPTPPKAGLRPSAPKRSRRYNRPASSAERHPTGIGEPVFDLSRLARLTLDQAEFDDPRDDLMIERRRADPGTTQKAPQEIALQVCELHARTPLTASGKHNQENGNRPRPPMGGPRPIVHYVRFPGAVRSQPAVPAFVPAEPLSGASFLFAVARRSALTSGAPECLGVRGPATVTAPERAHAARYETTIRRCRQFSLTHLKFACDALRD